MYTRINVSDMRNIKGVVRKQISVVVSEKLHIRVKQAAAAEKISTSEFMERAAADSLRKRKATLS